MTCGGCAGRVRKAVLELDANAQIETEPSTRSLTVTSTMREDDLRRALAQAGYPAA